MNCELQPSLALDTLLSTASNCRYEIQIASAYAKSEPFRRICEVTTGCSRKKLIVRWQFCDLVSSASDLDIYAVAKHFGWRLYYHQDLHAKNYLLDDVLISGSSNLTSRGLAGGPPGGNIEYSIKCPSSPEVTQWFDSLVSKAVEVDDNLYFAIKSDIESYRAVAGAILPIRKGFSQAVNSLVSSKKTEPVLFLHDLPQSPTPGILMDLMLDTDAVRHDLQLFGLPQNPSLEQIRNVFGISPGYTWLLEAVGVEAFFGAITAKLHNSLRDEPKPYRSEVKKRLECLISWATALFPERILVDRPNHSQRIRRHN